MGNQKFYVQEYSRLNPEWRNSVVIYRNIVRELTTPETYILDIGCGHIDNMKSVFDKTPHVYGVDPDQSALDKNTLIKNKKVGVVEELPFESNFFDLVVLQWVLEHLDNPEKAFQEIYRVLKPGGKVVFLTPNIWNYTIFIIRLIPNRLHGLMNRKFYGKPEEDTYPTRYRINSVKKIAKTLEPMGFKKSQIIFNGDPYYLSINRPLFALACFIEKILDLKPFKSGKIYLIGEYEKTG